MYERILALDIATKTGWAYRAADGSVVSGVWDLSVKKGIPNGHRIKNLWSRLIITHRVRGIDFIVYERPGSLSGHARKVLPALQGAIELWSALNDVHYECYTPSTVKKHATGNGKANKKLMIFAAENKWPDLEIVDDNQVDALWLLDMVLASEDRV